MAAGQRRYHCRIIGSRGEAAALNFVEPHHDDRIIVITAAGTRTEELGRRSSYTYQLEAFAAHLRNGARCPPAPTTRSPTCSSSTIAIAPPVSLRGRPASRSSTKQPIDPEPQAVANPAWRTHRP